MSLIRGSFCLGVVILKWVGVVVLIVMSIKQNDTWNVRSVLSPSRFMGVFGFEVAGIVVMVVLFGLFDVVSTWSMVSAFGVGFEGNPVMAWILGSFGFSGLVLSKVFGFGLVLFMWVLFRTNFERKESEDVMWYEGVYFVPIVLVGVFWSVVIGVFNSVSLMNGASHLGMSVVEFVVVFF